MRKHSTPGARGDELLLMREAAASYRDSPREFNRTVPFSDAYPNIQIRVHTNGMYDSALRSFARGRFEARLGERFNVNDVKIVTLGMADDAGRSAAEVARFNRHIRRDFRDEVGPLAQLHSANYATLGAKVEALAPYRGRTVIVVGHIPNDLGNFFVFTSRGRVKVPIGEWMDAANQAGVNLIPLGCHSERLAQLGVKGAINSGTVLERLEQVLLQRPRTIGEFYGTLTANDLVLVMNPFELKIFSNSAEIVARETRETVGRVWLNAASAPIRGLSSRGWADFAGRLGLDSALAARVYDRCFASTDGEGFKGCVGEVDEAAQQAAAQKAAISAAQTRQQQRQAVPAELAVTAASANRQARLSFGVSLLYALIWPLAAFLIFHGLTTARRIEQDDGPSFRSVFSRTAIRAGLSTSWSVLSRPFGTFVPFLVLVIPLVGGSLVFLDIPDFLGDYALVFWAMAAVVVGWFALTLWDAFKTALEGSLAHGVSLLAVIALVGAAFLQVTTAHEAQRVRHEEANLRSRLESLKATEPDDIKLLASLKVEEAALTAPDGTAK